MRIAIVVGTRPEAIKLAPVAELLGPEACVIHTGQHTDPGMAGPLTPQLVLERSHRTTRGGQLGSWTSALDHAFHQHRPDVVLVQGDTTSAVAGALAANGTATPLVHIEAGLRSFDRAMPEERNRVLIDHVADLCCVPTTVAYQTLLAERVPSERLVNTGNTIVEAIAAALPDNDHQADILSQLGVASQAYVLATFHRPENADTPDTLATILRELAALPIPVILPVHPRTQRNIITAGLDELAGTLRLTGPLDYTTLLAVTRHAAVVISDSGGIQEEATVLKRPVLVIRRSNERPEVEDTFGTRRLPGPEINAVTRSWLSHLGTIQARLADLASPYGDGTASAHITHVLRTRFAPPKQPDPAHHRPTTS